MSRQQQAAGGGQDQNPEMTWMVLIAMLAGACWLGWKAWHGSIMAAVAALQLGEIWVISLFTDRLGDLQTFLQTVDSDQYAISQASYIHQHLAPYLRVPAAVLLAALAARMYVQSIELKYRHKMTLEGLIRFQSLSWPTILPIVDDNPLDEDKKKDGIKRWEPAKSPREWLVAHKLLSPNEKVTDESAMRTALAAQLKLVWRGPENLPSHLAALYAVFVCKACSAKRAGAEYDEATELLHDLARVWTRWGRTMGMARAIDLEAELRRKERVKVYGKAILMALLRIIALDFGRVLPEVLTVWLRSLNPLSDESKKRGKRWAELKSAWRRATSEKCVKARTQMILAGKLADEDTVKAARAIADRHAYAETALASLLEWARKEGGVLPSAEFVWLKPADRNSWYIMNAVGRRTAFAEAAGTFAHWLAERSVNKPLPSPVVDEAVIGYRELFAFMEDDPMGTAENAA